MTPSPVKVKATEIVDAYELTSGGNLGDSQAYLCLDSGKIYVKSVDIDDDVDWAEKLPDDLETSDRYIPLPQRNELQLGRRLVLSFMAEAAPDDYDQVAQYFQRRGAYGRFKALLAARNLLDSWYEFEHKSTESALREWCEANGIELVEDTSISPQR